ncbi:hypothetical protein C4B63_9g250 [Trypanosoma cruzi]|nr:hypothetical protein C4B63_9g250 [Trypanosoma cruzi]
MTHNRPGAPPTESLVCWFQTVVAERVDEDGDVAVATEGGELREKVPRKACVLFVPVFSTFPQAVLPKFFNHEEISGMKAYCTFIRSEILKNIGLDSCGSVIDSMRAEAEANKSRIQELASEREKLEKLSASDKLFAAAAQKLEDDFLENERRALRFYQAKEELASIVGIDSIPVDVYLMRYVMPSLTPLMAEVVRMRPEDPVTVLADALFHHKRQVSL